MYLDTPAGTHDGVNDFDGYLVPSPLKTLEDSGT